MVCTPRILMISSMVVGAVAVATLALSVATDAWLFTTEKFEEENSLGNETIEKEMKTQMGLWKVCTISLTGEVSCFSYDSVDEDSEEIRETHKTSFAIMKATRVAALFPVVALVMITLGVILGILGNIRQDVKTLLAAVIFILSGLTLAVGIIFYISAINDEVGHSGKSGNSNKPAFIYYYGWSFFFAGIAFAITEATAVVFVTLYMQRNSSTDDMVRIIPGLEDKFDNSSEKEDSAGTSNPTIIL